MKWIKILVISSLLMTCSLQAIERKQIKDVNSDALTSETQAVDSINGFNMVWWIPIEFWDNAFSSDPTITVEQTQEIVDLLKPYSMLAIVQADVSAFGAFNFYDREKISSALSIKYLNENNKKRELSEITDLPADVELLIQQMKPVLTAAMGNMGQSMEFYVFEDKDNGERVINPYKKGELQIGLQTDKKPISISISTPLDSLFVPRKCPNQKDAHITWNYCPWDGSKLEK